MLYSASAHPLGATVSYVSACWLAGPGCRHAYQVPGKNEQLERLYYLYCYIYYYSYHHDYYYCCVAWHGIVLQGPEQPPALCMTFGCQLSSGSFDNPLEL